MKGNEILAMRARALLAVMTLAIAVAFTPGLGTVDASAATMSPAKPTITSTNVHLADITVKWSKAKNAKSYQVALRTSSKKWCYEKTVKGTKSNNVKYTQPGKYKVVKITQGKHKGKFKVYRYKTVYSYKTLKNTTSRTYTYKATKRGTKYTLAVRSISGSKKSSWAAKSATTWNKDTVLVDGKKHTHKWEKQYKDETRFTTKSVLVDTVKHDTKVGTNTVCITCNEPILFTEGEAEPTSPEVDEALQEHTSTGCNSDGTKFEDKIETTYEDIYEDQEVEETIQVLSGYECSCNATKTLDGKVAEHVHTWGNRIEERTEYREAEFRRAYIVCSCGKEFVVKYRDADGVWHDYVEKGNPDKWHSACEEYDKHWNDALDNDQCGASSNRGELYKIEMVPTTVEYTETYCTVCGRIK